MQCGSSDIADMQILAADTASQSEGRIALAGGVHEHLRRAVIAGQRSAQAVNVRMIG